MIRNYLLIALRQFLREKRSTVINLVGLSVGLVSTVMIILYVFDELSFNSMHPHPERTWRLGLGHTDTDGTLHKEFKAPGSWARLLKENRPEVQQTLRVCHVNFPTLIENKEAEKQVLTNDCRWVEPHIAELIAIDLVAGDIHKLFKEPNSIALSQTAAKTLFGSEDPLGRTVTVKDNEVTRGQESTLTVTGVYKDYTANSTFRFQYLMNIESLRPFIDDFNRFLDRNSFELYVLMNEGTSLHAVDGYLQQLSDQVQREYANFMNKAFVVAVSLPDIHFNNEVTWDFTGTVGNKSSLALLLIVALLILGIACINYMNLATAKATFRAREVGVRKAVGSSRKSLMLQFFIESFTLSLVSVMMALLLAMMLLPWFNQLSGKNFGIAELFVPRVLLLFVGVMMIAAFAGGSYPALLLSGFKPIHALRGRAPMGTGSEFLRRFLVTVQYVMALMLILVAIVTVRQTSLMHDSKLNKKGDQIVMLRWGSTNIPYQNFFSLRNALLQDPEITDVSIADAFPRLGHWGKPMPPLTFPELGKAQYSWNQLLVDFDFMKLFNLTMAAGRAFDPGNPADSTAIVINEAAVRNMGKTNDEVIGQTVSIELGRDREGNIRTAHQHVIGVAKDFPYETMRMTISPLTMFPNPNLRWYTAGTMVYVKLPKDKIREKLGAVEATWKKLFPDVGLQYYFVNELFGRMYKSEMTLSRLFLGFSVLAVLITLFGLYGLSSFSAERRTKEIGIRKIHGASTGEIAWLLLSSFVRIFALSAALVIPLSYFVLARWLNTFQYRTSLGVGLYGLGIGLILVVTLLAVGYETLKAALNNPAKALRYE